MLQKITLYVRPRVMIIVLPKIFNLNLLVNDKSIQKEIIVFKSIESKLLDIVVT